MHRVRQSCANEAGPGLDSCKACVSSLSRRQHVQKASDQKNEHGVTKKRDKSWFWCSIQIMSDECGAEMGIGMDNTETDLTISASPEVAVHDLHN